MINLSDKTKMFGLLLCFLLLLPVSVGIPSEYDTSETLVVAQQENVAFSSIAAAVKAASDGDTILVKEGIYQENIVIDKRIQLIGEHAATTIIDGNDTGDCLYIDEDGVTVRNITLQNSGPSGRDCGIELHSNFSTISQVLIKDCTVGLYLRDSDNNNVIKNTFFSNKYYGVQLHTSSDNYIGKNIFERNRWGVFAYRSSNNNLISQNKIINSSYQGIWTTWCNENSIEGNVIKDAGKEGIYLSGMYNAVIQHNHLEGNTEGIFLSRCNQVQIQHNNFIDNKKDASYMGGDIEWRRNYWNRFRIAPKIIFDITPAIIHSFSIDWRPAFRPYDIHPDVKSLSDKKNTVESNVTQISTLPDSFDYRNIDGVDYTTAVKNQVPAPTCEAYALCASLETMMQYNQQKIYEPDLSETFLYFFAGGTYEAGGVLLDDAAEFLVTTGVPDEGIFPDPHRNYDYDFESLTLPGWEDRTVKITEWGWVDDDPDSIKQGLIDHGPLVICVVQRADFFSYSRGVYKPFRFLPIVNGHVITIVGYDDHDGCWIVKNSAGPNWGDDGYVRISYDAHTKKTPIFYPFYGGTGFLYVEGIYGNLDPATPKIQITNLDRQHTYVHRFQFPTQFKDLENVTKALPRIIDWAPLEFTVEDADGIRFYLDGHLKSIDEDPPFSFTISTTPGVHTVEAVAFNEQGMSKDIRDFYMF